MESINLNKAELAALLNHLGISQLLGVEPGLFPAQDEPGSDELAKQGLSQLVERELVTLRDGEVDVDSDIQQRFEAVSNPQAIVHTFKETAEEAYWAWHYIAGSAIVELVPVGQDQFRLAKVADLESVADYVEGLLPLEPVPDLVQYRADVPQEDAEEITSLADGWDMVPALSLLEADGLKMAEARDLFNDLADYQWWGRVDMMACETGQIKTARRVIVLQGQERSWVARQRKPEVSTIHIETAQAGEFEAFLSEYWAELND